MRLTTRCSLAGAVTFLLLVRAAGAAAPAAGADAADAEALIRQGLALRKEGQEREALPHFQRAYELARTPRAAAQLGFAEQALGLWADAESHFGEALAATQDPWVREQRALIEESARFVERHLGSVVVETAVAGADVLLDQRVAGRTPLARPIRAAAGARRIELRGAGFAPVAETVTVVAGRTARVSLKVPLPPAMAGRSEALLPMPAPEPPPVVAAAALDEREAPRAGDIPLHRRWWFWAGMGAAVIGAVAVTVAATSGLAPFPCGGGTRVCAR